MEKTPASFAMDWSIELEKSLRSHKPGKSIEALEEIGRRLKWWNSEPKMTYAEYKLFGLIPGEDKLFLNAIFLRLADAFRLGDKQIKKGVVKIFLRMKRRKKRDGEGILSQGKLENYVELLSRVKEVFDRGDVEERALALLLFGFWAYFTKHCADVRYIVLSSLVTDDVLQMKAALFAAGCLSELSDDFANVFLEILGTTVLSQEKSKSIKLAGGRAFAKMWCSLSLAEKAYKTGLKLLMDSSEEEFSAVMLISLSRIASRWMFLIPTQIELLTLFQSEERPFHVQATSLRCHCFILGKGVYDSPSVMGTIHKLLSMLYRSELQPTLQLEAVRVLYKILLLNLSIIPCAEIPDLFQQLFIIVKNMLESSIVSTRALAVSVLADLSGKVLGRPDVVSGGIGSALAFQMISFVLDQLLLLVIPKVDVPQADFAADLEVKSLLNTLFNLVEKHSYLHCLVLNNVCIFIDKLMKMLDKVMDTERAGLSNHEMTEFGSHGKPLLESKIILPLSKIIVACLQGLENSDAETIHILNALKLQAENVCHCSYIGSYTIVTYFLILHLHSTFIRTWHITEDLMSPGRKASVSCVDSILQLDKSTLDCAKKLLGRNSYWYSYKAGKTAACRGAWSTAAFIFEQLMMVVQSGSCFSWLKSLAQLSNSEKQIQLFLLSGQGPLIDPADRDTCEIGVNAMKTNNCNYADNLLRACDTLLSAEMILAAADMGHIFSFQRWFLTLRARALKTVIDMMKLLHTISSTEDDTGIGQLARGAHLSCTTSQGLGPFIDPCMELSYRMKNLAREFDLLLTSFMGMDRESMMLVSAFALSYSLIAFTAGFAFLVLELHSSENNRASKSGNSKEPFHALLIEDLVGRLRHIDCKTRKNLLFLLKSFRNCNACISPRFKTRISCSYEDIVLHKLCEYSVGEIICLQNDASRLQRDGDAFYQIIKSGSQLLMNIMSKLMLITFRMPRYFFRVRPAVSSELFVMNEDGLTVDGSSIPSGLPLTLNLSFQLKNMPAGLPDKVYCILNCKPHSQLTTNIGEFKWEAHLSWQDDEMMDDMLGLNEKLLKYVTSSVETRGLQCRSQDNDCSAVSEYVCFELNERGQGFSTCFLDVSSLPVGSYQIKWLSCYIDSRGSYGSLLPVNAGPLITIS